MNPAEHPGTGRGSGRKPPAPGTFGPQDPQDSQPPPGLTWPDALRFGHLPPAANRSPGGADGIVRSMRAADEVGAKPSRAADEGPSEGRSARRGQNAPG